MIKMIKILFLLAISFSAFAGVNLKNGNFYVSYTDIIVPGGGHDLEITRTYNSKSTENGWFGFGWGSNYETYLTVSADGSVVVHENGGGALTRFVPKATIDPVSASKKIINAMRKRGNVTAKDEAHYLKKFKSDAELRQAYARKYGVTSKLAAGTVLYSNMRGVQKIIVTKDSYLRVYSTGKEERFSKSGKLNRMKLKNGYSVVFTYNSNGNLLKMKDSQAKQLFFEWYPNKKIKKIWSTGGKASTYKFDQSNLVESVDIAGNGYKFIYDPSRNLTSVSYSDGTKMSVAYGKKTQFVESVTSRNGEQTSYKYGADSKRPNLHYWTDVIKKRASGKTVKNHYEYEIKVKADGAQYTYRIKTIISGVTTETVYTEESLPAKIARGKFITNFKYDNGLLTEKSNSRGDFYRIKYDKKHGKIAKVTDKKGWTQFTYDRKGNLSKAVNNKGKSVVLVYDRKGRITKMVDKRKSKKKDRILTFKYNAMDKPVQIEMKNVGKINVAYDNYGEIKKVESKAGQRMALQVTQAFQSLLAIVKPAGVNLNL